MKSEATIREIRLFEFYAKYIWPIHRLFARRYISKRCRQCAISTNHTALAENGVCSMCRNETKSQSSSLDSRDQTIMKRELDTVLRSASGTGQWKYDALVLFSGGKDSSFLLHQLQQEYLGLRVMALTVDNGFMSPVALENIKHALSQLGVDHMMYEPNKAIVSKMFAYAFTHLNEHGTAGTVDQFDGDFIHDVARNIASQLEIPLILSGVSPTQVEQLLGLHTFESPREFEKSKRTEVAGIALQDVFTNDEMNYWWDGQSHPDEKIPRMIFPFYAWGYNESTIRHHVSELGLIEPARSSPLVTNSQLVPLMGLVDMAARGYSSFEPQFAELIRAGKADKTFWRNVFELLEYSAKTGWFIAASVDTVLARLNLTRADVGIGKDIPS